MHQLTFLYIISLCVSFILPSVDATCCDLRGKLWPAVCWDDTPQTPCCGYGKCNAFCCKCQGVTVIESTVDYSGTTYVTTLTAPSDPVNGQKTWTCREGNLLLTVSPPPTTVFVQPTTVTVTLPATDESHTSGQGTMTNPSERSSVSPSPTALPVRAVDYPSLEERDALADQIQLFEDLSGGLQINGTSVVSKEQYLGFFNIAEAEIGGHYGQNVLAKFAMHDLNGDGVLSFEETQLHCGGDGCH